MAMPPSASAPLRWQGYEHEHIERGNDWYWALGIAALCLATISVLLGDALFGLLILVAGVTLALMARRPPPLVEFELSDRGVRVGDEMHRYEEILAFWVEEHETNPPLLLVDTKKWMTPNIVIPIHSIDPKQVRAYLKERCEEVPMREPAAHKILEFFGL